MRLLFSTAFLYTNNPTGGIRRFKELSEYMKDQPDVIVCSFDKTDEMQRRGFSHHVHIDEGKTGGLYRLLPSIFKICFTNRKVLNKLRRQHYDKVIVFDESPTTGLLSWGFRHITMLIRKDSIGYERVSFKGNPILREVKLSLLWFWELLCVIGVQRIVTQCEYDRIVIQKRHPILAGLVGRKTAIQINNVNPSWIVSKSLEESVNVELPLHSKFRVCFIGGFNDARKGQDLFLEIAAALLKDKEDIEFVLIGGGRGLEKYKKDYSNPSIIFCGRQTNPLGILRQCDLLIVPSLADSCPNTVMEALYNEVLVLGSKRGGIPEILVDEESLFDFDVDVLKKKILMLKNSTIERDNLRKLQKERKRQLTFNWAEKMTNII